MRQYFAKALLASSLGLAACDLDTTNPNAPTQETVVSDVEGLLALGVGLQARFGVSTANFTYSAGLLTTELGAIGTAFSTISDAEGGTVPPGAAITGDVWRRATVPSRRERHISHRGRRRHAAGNAERAARSRLPLQAGALGELLQSYKSCHRYLRNPTPGVRRSRVPHLHTARAARLGRAPTRTRSRCAFTRRRW